MDIALVRLAGREVQYSGAHNPLWIARKGATLIEEIKANKQPSGKDIRNIPFTAHSVQLDDGDTIYLFSDGYSDQFGGAVIGGKKFKSSNFKKLLIPIQKQTSTQQCTLLDEAFEQWRGDNEQLDDVCVIGVRV
jgi:serine phosphatase RsbU (regulator of sigma subunit)